MLEKLTNRDVSPEAEHRIRDYMLESVGTGEIMARLQDDPEVPDFPGDRTISAQRKQIDRVKKDLLKTRDSRLSDISDVWTIKDTENPEHAALALAVLAHVNKWSGGNIAHLTRNEADAIIRIRIICPRLLLHDVWDLAQEYVARRVDNRGVQELEVFIAQLRLAHEPGALLEPVPATGSIQLAPVNALKEVRE